MDYIITARCANGHEQQIVVDGMLGLEWVKEHAALIDGTSSLYMFKPAEDPESVIGKCGRCQARFECEVTAARNGTLEKT